MKADHNQRLTRTGAATPMGRLFRRYWLPVLAASELPGPDCPPVRVRLLGERLIAIRDSSGRLGLLDEHCPHRRASLWFGRNEEGGIRCAYHGWKFGVDGRCLEIPSEPEGSRLCDKIRLVVHPLIERGGVLWAYLGPEEHRPPLPEHEWATVPADQRFVSRRLQHSNWLQALEGSLDSSHTSFLHRYAVLSDPLFRGGRDGEYNLGDLRPSFEVSESEGGLRIAVRRETGDGRCYWRVTELVLPSFTSVPPRADHPIISHCYVPIDDVSTWVWSMSHRPDRPLGSEEREAMEAGTGPHAPTHPGTLVPLANRDNDYLIDRRAQREGRSFSGVTGFAAQDAAIQESMGPIVDRTRERLVSTDRGIIAARRRLLEACNALDAEGRPPPGTTAASQRVRPISVVLPPGVVPE